MTKRLRHTPEQIVRKLRKADELAADGKTADEIAWPSWSHETS
jgi:hypothetical protein